MRIALTNLITYASVAFILLAGGRLTASAASPSPASACVRDYTVQLADSVSAIAEKYHGDVLAYPAIVDATNQMAQEDSRYDEIASADLIEPGQVLCIPSQEAAQALLEETLPSPGNSASDVTTKSSLVVGYEQTIPIISIVADWGDLESLNANPTERGREWERPVNIEYIEPGGQAGFNVKAGIRVHGGRSRTFSPKKSYRIYFRKSYGGPGRLDYPLFEDSVVTKFDKLILRAGYNDAFSYLDETYQPTVQSTGAVYIRDQVVRNLHRDMGQPVAHGRWVLLYLNGEYWGLYNLTERVDLEYMRSYSDPESEWDIVEKEVSTDNGEWVSQEVARDGNYGGWLDNQNWVGSVDFSNPANIGDLEWRVDMENVYSYMFLQAYVQNYDWPGNNWTVYQRTDVGAEGNERKWRMMVWDAEYAFGGGSRGFQTDMNTLVKAYSPHDSISRILEKPFIHNCGLKHQFVNRSREYLGVENPEGKPADQVGQLSKERVRAEVLRQAAIVRPFIQMEAERWVPGRGMGVELFDQNLENVLIFVDEREEVVLHHLDELRYQTFTDCK